MAVDLVYAVSMKGSRGAWRAESGRIGVAREFVPETHRELPMLRIYLPFRDPALPEGQDIVRWSKYVRVEERPGSLDWFEVAEEVAYTDSSVWDLVSCMGELDGTTADALRDAIGDVKLRCLRWTGYSDTPRADWQMRVFREDYFDADVDHDDVRVGCRIPDFAWDADGRLAWGGRLYPDSLIVAAEVPIFRQLRGDPRLDSAPIRADRDFLPPSAGD